MAQRKARNTRGARDVQSARHMAVETGASRRRRWPIVVVVLLVLATAGGIMAWRVFFAAKGKDESAQVAGSAEGASGDRGDVAEGASGDKEDTAEDQYAEDQDTTDSGETASDTAASDLAARFSAGDVQSVRLVGDSITAGFGTTGYVDANLTGTGTVIYDNGSGFVRYETPADAQCWANAFRTWATEHGVTSFVNAGINGAFMTELAQNPDAWLQDGADVVFVALGTNDAGYESVQEYEAAARTALAAAAEKSQVLVVISPVCDLRPESWLMSSPKELGDVLRAICEEKGYLFVDAYDAVAPEQFCDDGLHPATSGSLAIWDCIRTTLGL